MIPSILAEVERKPLPLARAMALASAHYYATREPFGPGGDFVTAPEISQMFGEMIGLFLADLWQRAGRPAAITLAELGPGRGTLMQDALRAIGQACPAMLHMARVAFVERSPRLRDLQRRAVPDAVFCDNVAALPADRPLFLVANEFLDALPISQFEKTPDGWAMRAVGPNGFDLSLIESNLLIPDPVRGAEVGAIYERGFAAEGLVADIARRLAKRGGVALFIDYGYEGPALGDTLQALQGGKPADVVATLGEADISAHVDFHAMAQAARAAARGMRVQRAAQGTFLDALGMTARAERLKAGKPVDVRAGIEAAHARLVMRGAMGQLFQVLALSPERWPEPAGFPAGGRFPSGGQG